MANEVVVLEGYGPTSDGDIVRKTCAAATALSYGTVVYLSADPNTVAKSDAGAQVFGGVVAADKTSYDGKTNVSVYRDIKADVVASGAITVGQLLVTAGNNQFKAAAAADVASSYAVICGVALETATDGETIAARLHALI